MRYGPIDLIWWLGHHPKIWIGGLIACIAIAGIVSAFSALKRRRQRLAQEATDREEARAFWAADNKVYARRGFMRALIPLPQFARPLTEEQFKQFMERYEQSELAAAAGGRRRPRSRR